MRPALFGISHAIALLALALPGHAQLVRGTLTNPETGGPVEGAMLHLLDEAGQTVAARLSDAAGRFFLAPARPGTYRVRADRIGHASSFSAPLTLSAADTVMVRMQAVIQAVVLEGIDVRTDKRCVVRPTEGESIHRVWDETRKALEAAAWSDEHGVYQYRIRFYDRKLDRDARRVEDERSRMDGGWRKRTFTSLPAQILADSGYVQADGDGFIYNAPDADVLLSDAFLDTHCFRLREEDDDAPGMIGLSFEPIRGRRVSDIRGTFWMERATSELKRIEYRYVNLDLGVDLSGTDLSRVGGQVEFQRLPSGPWVVRRWDIRMPLLASQLRNGRRVGILAGIQQHGAEVVRIEDNRKRVVLEAATATVVGSVMGEFNLPVEGASVRIVGTDYQTVTDSAGGYRIPGVLEGTYRITYSHPTLDSLGFVPDPQSVEAVPGTLVAARFQMPSRWDVLTQACADTPVPEGTASVIGSVLEAGANLPLEGVTVALTWSDWAIRGQDVVARSRANQRFRRAGSPSNYQVQEGRWTVQVHTDQGGVFIACGIPTNHPVRIAGAYGPFATEARIRIPAGATSHHEALSLDLELTSSRQTTTSDESLAAMADLVGFLRRELGPSVRVSDYSRGGTGTGFCIESTRRRPAILGEDSFNGCRPAYILLDGQPLQDATGGFAVSATTLLQDISPDQFESVLWIPPLDAMTKYGQLGRYGALEIETRSGG